MSSTRWTLVLRANASSHQVKAALSDLCEAYYQPVFVFLRRMELAGQPGFSERFQREAQALANGDNARELFTQNLLTTDPEMVVWGFCDLVVRTGHEQALREFARVLRSLPQAKLMPELGTDLQTNLVLREVRDGGKLWFITANPGNWPLRAEAGVATDAPVFDAVSGRLVAERKSGGHGSVSLDLKPDEVRTFRVDDANAKLAGWKNKPVAEADLAHIHAVLPEAAILLAQKSRAAGLLPDEREFMVSQIIGIRNALAAQEIAKAWSLITI